MALRERTAHRREFALAADGAFPLETLAASYQGHPLLIGRSCILASGFGLTVWAWGAREMAALRDFLHTRSIEHRSSGWHGKGYAINFASVGDLARFHASYAGRILSGP